MSNSKSAAQIKRREEIATAVAALREKWPACKESLDEITKLVAIEGVDAARVFFALTTQNNDLDDPTACIERWANHRLVQVEALEALSNEQQEALEVSEESVAEMAEK